MADCTRESLGLHETGLPPLSTPSSSTELSQAEIQSVLDSIFFSTGTTTASNPLPPSLTTSSSSSSSSSLAVTSSSVTDGEERIRDTVSSTTTITGCNETISLGRRVGTQVSLPHLLHSHLYLTPQSLSLGPASTHSFAGCTGVITTVDDSRGVICLSLTPPTPSIHTLLLYRPSIQLLEPVKPREGEVVRLVRGVNAGLEGILDVCKETFQYMLRSLCGRYGQLVSISDLVRLVRPVSTGPTPSSPLAQPQPGLSPSPPPSRPMSLGNTDYYLLQSQGQQLMYETTPMTYEAMPSPSLSPSSPWMPYSPQDSDTPLSPSSSSLGIFPSRYPATFSHAHSSLQSRGHQSIHSPLHNMPFGYSPSTNGHISASHRLPVGVANQVMMPHPPLPSYVRPQAPPTYQSVVNRAGGNGCGHSRTVPNPTQNGCGLSTSHAQKDRCCVFKKFFHSSLPMCPSKGSNNDVNIIDQLKNLACSNGKFKSPVSCPGRVIQPDLLIDKVIGNLMAIDPPDNWYTDCCIDETCISDDISAESITVSSNCPITKQKMAYPSRGLNCTHLQCFDAKAFLHMALRKYRKSLLAKGQGSQSSSSSGCAGVCLKCPVCNKVIILKELIIDKYLKKVLEVSEASELQCQGKGNWKPVEKTDQPPLSVIDLTIDDD